MSINLTLVQDENDAKLIVISNVAAAEGFEFSFTTDIIAQNASFEGADLEADSGSFSINSTTTNDIFNGTVTGRVSTPVAIGDEILSFEFDVESAGRLEVQGFTGTLNDVAFAQPDLPAINTVDPDVVADFINGTFAVGNDLSVDFGSLPDTDNLPNDAFSVVWLRNGEEIPGATNASYTLTEDDRTAAITVQVSYTDDDGQSRVLQSTEFAPSTGGDDAIEGTSGDDVLTGTAEADVMRGLAGDDRLEGLSGNDLIDGGSGVDTSVHSGTQDNYTLTVSQSGTTLIDRRADGDGQDILVSVEAIDFAGSDASFNLAQVGGAAGIDDDALEDIIELYIAYFNRAPDAVGLNFWGTAYENGTSLEDMARLFEGQPETQARYPSDLSNSDFVQQVYSNVLGRDADADGLDFWTSTLDRGSVGRDTFVLELLKGVDAEPAQDASAEFIAQQDADDDFLEDQTDLGAYFAVHKGLNDLAQAEQVLANYDGSAASVTNAVAAINGFYDEAIDPANGAFVMQLVGVLDTDFV
ncbi:DUF4214 domain-containing protein [Marivita sp. S0852]|uniref:DUF4214 domain-containing protein n=1 Tax=Marivita sp. S0852 TaxID=3373893 RepID=UPI0039823661